MKPMSKYYHLHISSQQMTDIFGRTHIINRYERTEGEGMQISIENPKQFIRSLIYDLDPFLLDGTPKVSLMKSIGGILSDIGFDVKNHEFIDDTYFPETKFEIDGFPIHISKKDRKKEDIYSLLDVWQSISETIVESDTKSLRFICLSYPHLFWMCRSTENPTSEPMETEDDLDF